MTSDHPARIAVIGSANADLVLDIDHRPAPGETILGADLVTTPGGKGANQAVAAARSGGDVAFIGRIGRDGHGHLLRTSLTEAGVDISALAEVDTATGTATIMVTPDGENAIIVSPAANRAVTVEAVEQERALWKGAAIVVLQLEIPVDTVAHVAREAAGAGSRVILNAAPAATLPADVLATADPLVVNESEAEFLLRGASGGLAAVETTHETSPPLAEALLDLGPRSVVLTLGAAGAVVAERSEAGHVRTERVPAHRVEAIDTTGAGDGFVGALSVGLAKGDALPQAVAAASRFAAVAVTRRGAQAAYPTAAELAAFEANA